MQLRNTIINSNCSIWYKASKGKCVTVCLGQKHKYIPLQPCCSYANVYTNKITQSQLNANRNQLHLKKNPMCMFLPYANTNIFTL